MGGMIPDVGGGGYYRSSNGSSSSSNAGGQYPNSGTGGGYYSQPASQVAPSPFKSPATISPSSIATPPSVSPSPGMKSSLTPQQAVWNFISQHAATDPTLAQFFAQQYQAGNPGAVAAAGGGGVSSTVGQPMGASRKTAPLVGTPQPTSSGIPSEGGSAPGSSPLGQATQSVNQYQQGLQGVQQQQQSLAQSILNPAQVQQVINALTGLTNQAQSGQQALQNLAGSVSQQLQTPLTQTPGFQQSANRALDQLRGSENAAFQQGLQQLNAQGILRGGAPLALTQNIAQDTAAKASGLLGNLTAAANQQYPQQLLQSLGALAQGYQIPFGMNQSALQGMMNFLGLGNNLLGGAAGTQANLLGSSTSQFNTLAQVQEALQAAQAQQQVLQQELPLIQQSLGSGIDPSMLAGLMNYLSPVGVGTGG